MKKLFLILALITFAVAGFSQDHTYNIKPGGSTISWPPVFTAADSIVTSDSLVIQINNIQKYMQHQTLTTTLTDVDGGSPSVVITFRGRVNSNDSWHPIGSAGTWTSVSNNPTTITSTTPKNYNQLKVSYVASGATQHLRLATLEVRTANVFDIPANSGTLTVSRATSGTVTITSADNDSNAALTVAAGGTGALTLGDASSTTAITSSDWAIGTTGIATGLGAITSNGLITTTAGADVSGATTNINASSNFATNINTGTSNALVSIGGGSNTLALNSTAWGITSAGVYSGLSYTGAPTVIWAAGGSTVLATSGTDVACANGTRFWVELNIPYKVSLTGIAYLVGSVGGTDSVVVQLHNSAGVEVATSKKTGANHGAIVGTAAQFQSCPFYVGASATPYVAAPGKYFVSVQFNGTTAKFRAYPIPGSKFITGTAAGTWNTAANITPGTTFTADKGPIIMTY